MIKSYLIIILFIFYTSCVKAADHGNGFGSEIFTEPPVIKNESIVEETEEDIVEENLHPLLRYDLNKYLVIGTVLELANDKHSLAIIRTPDGTDHIVFLEDILSNNEPPWIVKKINVRGITVQKEVTDSAENLDENGNLVYLEKHIDVNNPTINLTEMNKN